MTDRSGVVRSHGYRKYYDRGHAEGYVRGIRETDRKHRDECALVARAFERVPKRDRVLDIPCGGGRMTAFLLRLGYDVSGADVSPAMLEIARRRLGEAAHFESQDLERTTYADGAFDTVFSFRLFHHFPTATLRAQIVGELCRIAGKRVVVSYLDSRSFTSRRLALENRVTGRPVTRYSIAPAAIAALFRERGFRRVADLARLPLLRTIRLAVFER
jgi:SAM-dependent methyltransferase